MKKPVTSTGTSKKRGTTRPETPTRSSRVGKKQTRASPPKRPPLAQKGNRQASPDPNGFTSAKLLLHLMSLRSPHIQEAAVEIAEDIAYPPVFGSITPEWAWKETQRCDDFQASARNFEEHKRMVALEEKYAAICRAFLLAMSKDLRMAVLTTCVKNERELGVRWVKWLREQGEMTLEEAVKVIGDSDWVDFEKESRVHCGSEETQGGDFFSMGEDPEGMDLG